MVYLVYYEERCIYEEYIEASTTDEALLEFKKKLKAGEIAMSDGNILEMNIEPVS